MTKIFVSIDQTPEQANMLMSQFVKTRKGESHNAMSIAQLCAKVWGVKYDWHDWSNVLSALCANTEIELIGHDNMSLRQYWIGS